MQRVQHQHCESVLVMEQELQLQVTQVIKNDLSTSPYLRYYLQEEVFHSPLIDKSMELPFNQIAAEVVSELHLTSRLLSSNSRLTANILENGKEIYQKKKKQYFRQFLNEYQQIGRALQNLPKATRLVIQCSVMAISNLILKLSINMSKISIVLVTKLYTPPCLNIFTTSLLFQKFLEVQLLRSRKQNRSSEQYPHLVQQFPKIAYLKISKFKDSYLSNFVRKSQQLFSSQACNIQLIQLYEDQGIEVYDLQKELIQQRSGQKSLNFNLNKILGINSPYGMELYLFFTQIIIGKMVQFKPDVIIFIEDINIDGEGVEPQVQGIILNELSAKVQNKIYIFKEFGFISFELHNSNISNIDLKQQTNKLLTSAYQCSQMVPQSREQEIKKGVAMQTQVFNRVSELRKQQFLRKKNIVLLIKEVVVEISSFQKRIKKSRQTLFNQLSYLSLALIQKSNFQRILLSFNNYVFPSTFLNNLLKWIKEQQTKIQKQKKPFSQYNQQLKNKTNKIRGMLQISQQKCKESIGHIKQITPFQFFNFYSNKIQTFTEHVQFEIKNIQITQNDSIYVHYQRQNIWLFLFGKDIFKLYKRTYSALFFTFIRKDQYKDYPYLSARHSTFIANNKCFYKAFGQFQDKNWQDKSLICWLDFSKCEKDKMIQWKFDQYCHILQGKTKKTKIKVQLKKWGWGESLQENGQNLIVLGGGYNFAAQNQEKVNKHLYLIKNNEDVVKIGKTNNLLLNEPENIKIKNIIFPFVFGVPVSYSKGQLTILNTNGYLQHLNHCKRFFLTKIRISLNSSYNNIGVIAQNKMEYLKDSVEQSIANKNALLSILNKEYHHINRFGYKSSYNDVDKRPVLVGLVQKQDDFGFDQVIIDKIKQQNDSSMTQDSQRYGISFRKKKLILQQTNKGVANLKK